MNISKSIASLTVTLDHARERLEPRASLDDEGEKLVHEIKVLLSVLEMWKQVPPPRSEVREMTDRAASVHERVTDYLTGRRVARVANMLPDSTRPPAEMVTKIRYAQEGPNAGPEAETLESCPACHHCTLCGDRRFVPVSTASQWRIRNVPRP